MRLIMLVLAAALSCAGCTVPPPIRVMSFNIRCGTARDGENHWDQRRELVFQTIREARPDLIGLQEVLAFQGAELCEALEGYEFVGAGRDNGRDQGEMVPIMFRRKVFQLLDFGFMWLGEAVDKPGVKAWDAACPRMLTWVRLRFTHTPFLQLYVVNTHFDHVGERARLESARLVRQLTDALGGNPVVVLGDFNCGPSSPPYNVLVEDRGNLAELKDTYSVLGLDEAGAGTYHAFRGDASGRRIDWILFNRRLAPLEAAIDRRDFGGRYPSDHFPVTTTLRLRPVSGGVAS